MSTRTEHRNTPLLIHPGYHKTGTTWFQRSLFRESFGYHPIMSHEEVFARLVRPHTLTFDPHSVCDAISSRRGQGEGGSVDVISCEILSGNPFYGGRESAVYAERLKRVAPDARILLSIREQTRALTSVYMQYLSRSGTMTPAKFFEDAPVMGYFAFEPEHYEYDRLVQLYCELFGAANVHVVTQEALARDPLGVARNIAAFSGAPAEVDLKRVPSDRVGASQPEACAPVLRRINHFRAGPAGQGIDLSGVSNFAYRAVGALARSRLARPALSKARPVTETVMARYAGRFAESNRRLKALLGDRIDLAGYPM